MLRVLKSQGPGLYQTETFFLNFRSYGAVIDQSEVPQCSQSALSIFRYPTDFVLNIADEHSTIYVPNSDKTHRSESLVVFEWPKMLVF